MKVWLNESKIIFMRPDTYKTTSIHRCFQFKLNVHEMWYQSLIAMSHLVIHSSKSFDKTYLYYLQENEELNFKSFLVDLESFFVKRIIKRSRMSKAGCLDYEKVYKSCASRSSCVIECIHKRFIEDRTVFFVPGSIVNKDHLTNDIWKNVIINYDHQYYNKTKIECESKYSKKDCEEELFENAENYGLLIQVYPPFYYQLNLPYYVISSIEEEQSVYKLMLDILNILSILFGINLTKLFSYLFYFKKLKFRYYNWSIFENIVNDDLIYSQYFKIEDSMFMTDLIFCFPPIYKQMDSNYKLTYK